MIARFTPDFTADSAACFHPDHEAATEGTFAPTAAPATAGVVIPPQPPPDLDALSRQGFEEGFAVGEQAGLEVGREKAISYLNTLAEAVAAATALRGKIRQEAHEDLVALAVAIAERLVRRELTCDRSILLDRVQDFLTEFDDATTVTLRMHPIDLAYAESCKDDWRQLFGAVEHLRLEESHDLQQGDMRIETPTTSLDARIESLLATVRERLMEAIDGLPRGSGT